MSTDPAVAAAQRAVNEFRGHASLTVVAAREALGPIRARHHAIPADARHDDGTRVCAHCLNDMGIPELWPCADARDAYPPEEL